MQKAFKTDFRSHDRWLTFTLVLGPVAALADLTISYALVPESCVRGSKMLLHVCTAAFLVACLAGAVTAWRIGRGFVATDPAPDRLIERTRWMAVAGIVLCVFSALIILAMAIPNFILRSCD